ncbi:MAG: MSMEG_0568 family radical SAM protein [Polyangiales bacterium]
MPSLPIWKPTQPPTQHALFELLTDLQTLGLRFPPLADLGVHRRAGAGPSDHKAVRLGGQTIMVPIHTRPAAASPFEVRELHPGGGVLYRDEHALMPIDFARMPRFYAGNTADGVPYWKIATLHGSDVLATTVLQKCVRYGNRQKSCQFCAIGQSLAAGSTIAEKTPEQLAEVARMAVALDGVKHAVLTTGTPPSDDRGAAVLTRCSAALRTAVPGLAVQAQCEPPADYAWFRRLHDAGVVTLGMHLEAVTEPVRQRIMPGKAEVPVSVYLEAFEAAVEVFGHGQVTTYILAGLGDSADDIVAMCQNVARLGVYPFVVPFVPIAGTPLADHQPPSAANMQRLLRDVASVLSEHRLSSDEVLAGCGRCGACSTLRSAETQHA